MVPLFGMCAGRENRRRGPCIKSKIHANRLRGVARLIIPLASFILPLSNVCPAQSNSSASPQAATPSAAAAQRAEQLMIEGKRLLDAGDLEKAEKSLRDCVVAYVAIGSLDAQALFELANCNRLLGSIASQRLDDDEALKLLRMANSLYLLLHVFSNDKSVDDNRIGALLDMARIYQRKGQNAEMLEVIRSIAEIQERLGDDAELALTKFNIGTLLVRLGRLHEAAENLQDAVTLSQRSKAPPESQAAYLHNLGSTEARLRDNASAEQHFRQAIALLQPLEHTEGLRATIKVGLSDALLDESHPEEARQQLEEALSLVSGLDEFREIRVRALTALARDTDERLHRKDDAMKLYREVLAQSEGLEGSEDEQLFCLNELGNNLRQAGRTAEATEMFRRGIAILDNKPNNVNQDIVALIQQSYGLLLLDAGNTSEALAHLLSALRVKWSWLSGDLEALSSVQKKLKIDQLFPLVDLSYTVALRLPNDLAPRAYEVLLLTKALHSEATRAEQQPLLYSATTSMLSEKKRYIEVRKEMSRRTLDHQHTEVPETDEGITKLASEEHELESQLRENALRLQRSTQLKAVGVDEVLSKLRPGEILLDYFTYSVTDLKTQALTTQHYGVFRLDGASKSVMMFDLGEASTIANAVTAVRDCEKQQTDPTNPSLDEGQMAEVTHQLKRVVFDPVLPSIRQVQRIYIAPDGLLGLVPFDAFPVAKTPSGWRYLAEDVEVVHLLTGRELTRTSSRDHSSNDVWLVGDPDFDSTPDTRLAALNRPSPSENERKVAQSSNRNSRPVMMGAPHEVDDENKPVPTDWPALEGTRSLVLAVAEQARKSGIKPRVLLGSEASEEFLSRIRAPRLLMFATHGYFLRSLPASVHISFTSGLSEDAFETLSPLHRSMLILAGANRRTHQVVRYEFGDGWVTEKEAAKQGMQKKELDLMKREVGDGLLTAYEISGIDLEDTELVILAGCESGLGVTAGDKYGGFEQAHGESVAGLRQAFTVAGARSIVTSLWEVPLDQTIDEIQGFVSGWLSRRLPRYKAFHESQLRILQAARKMNLGGHPFWWAGFVYFGDPGDR